MSRDGLIHVAMLPWSAFGHLIPFFQLSIALAKSGIHVSFLATPRNILRLPKIPPNLSNLIDFVPLPLPKPESSPLPESAEATVDIPADKIQYLKLACDLLQEPVRYFVSEKSPHWIIVDFFHHWAVDIAQDFNIPIVRFCVVSAATVVFFAGTHKLPADGDKRLLPQSWTLPPECVDFSSTVAYKKHEAEEMHAGYFGQNASGMPDGPRVAKIIQACKAIALRTCPEFEADYLKLHEKLTGKPVLPLGFLPPEKLERRSPTSNEEPWSGIFQWLDKQNPRSVVFVGFGSECKLNKDQIHEIAHGVELSGLPFLWALRKPDWADDDEDAFPAGFRERTTARGVAHVGWAPQREVLSHPSVGGCLFHAGWGSIIESLQYGHCLVFLPFIIDQPLNARLLVEKGLGVEVERGEDGSFSRYDIAKALEKAMVLKEGEEVRVRAREAGDGIFGDEKLHHSYVQKFVEYLKNETF
ncbi:UNVERIFIED_CONTAM: putative UDP-rhamnose:rhamnosyltransferase 1 [Sesamum calycinum]|uniref:UDP-rhamnose:rhamnosyltransferase 1 n=1 Tax=Sesamum calycinum TaxID=2727403 RepID=A0AAW2NXZ2_9LAMI